MVDLSPIIFEMAILALTIRILKMQGILTNLDHEPLEKSISENEKRVKAEPRLHEPSPPLLKTALRKT